MQVTRESRTALSRAKFFLDKANSCDAQSRVDFEAFLEASIVFARAALHRLKTKYERHVEWNAWWQNLLDDSAIKFFRSERDWILKEASAKLGQRIFVPSIGSEEPSYSPIRATEFYYFDDPSEAATTTVNRHLNKLEQHVNEAEHRFGNSAA